ncbi:hypothetical protein C8R45DRAFT_923208 [Mycena sanguinolenta]|nr:hypothetical protein C8R45DRAFT_923208 [Mycena sanguinolenta]
MCALGVYLVSFGLLTRLVFLGVGVTVARVEEDEQWKPAYCTSKRRIAAPIHFRVSRGSSISSKTPVPPTIEFHSLLVWFALTFHPSGLVLIARIPPSEPWSKFPDANSPGMRRRSRSILWTQVCSDLPLRWAFALDFLAIRSECASDVSDFVY